MARLIAAVALLTLIACTKPGESPAPPPVVAQETKVKEAAPLTTDRTLYQLRPGPYGPETTIVTTFTAPADKKVQLLNCNGAFTTGLQRKVGDQWVYAWTAEINGCHSRPIVIPAGGTYPGTITAIDRSHARVVPGTYRAVWYGVMSWYDMSVHPPRGEELPIEQRVSAPFVIE